MLKTIRKPSTLQPLYDITVTHHCKTRLMDHANILIASKAIQDQLVTAGIIVDDSPKQVRNLTFSQPRVEAETQSRS